MTRAPLVLLVSEDEWTARSLGTILAPRGYAVLRAYTAGQALERAAATDPDAVFISSSLPDLEPAQLCQALLERQLVSRAAPILLLAPDHTPREDKLRAFEAGAWDVVHLPMDAEEILLRLRRLTQGKLEWDNVHTAALIDQDTGLYNREGIMQRVREAGAAAERFGRPLACVVLTPVADPDDSDPLAQQDMVALAQRLRRSTRQSDFLARIGRREFAIVAPDTSPEGARVLADRLRDQTDATEPTRFRAGYYAVADLREARLDPVELMQRAATASRVVPTE